MIPLSFPLNYTSLKQNANQRGILPLHYCCHSQKIAWPRAGIQAIHYKTYQVGTNILLDGDEKSNKEILMAEQKSGAQISTKLHPAVVVLFLLMMAAGILTQVIPAGHYARVMQNGGK